MIISKEDIVRFWSKVDIQSKNKCWNWKAARVHDGYGRFGLQYRIVRAHRVSYQIAYGNFDERLCVLHKCDNPACVNPNHLFLGTNQDNMNDQKSKSRNPFGERNPRHKLTESQVIEIRKLYTKGLTQSEIGRMFNISQNQVSEIILRNHWKNVQE